MATALRLTRSLRLHSARLFVRLNHGGFDLAGMAAIDSCGTLRSLLVAVCYGLPGSLKGLPAAERCIALAS